MISSTILDKLLNLYINKNILVTKNFFLMKDIIIKLQKEFSVIFINMIIILNYFALLSYYYQIF